MNREIPVDRPDGEERLHVVWRFAGKVREYPHTDGTAFADGWKALPQIFDIIAETQALRERVRVLEGAFSNVQTLVTEAVDLERIGCVTALDAISDIARAILQEQNNER
jgi:hypothetical protein